MCDTMGRIVSEKLALFAKNSDRSPNEPQVVEFYKREKHAEKTVKCTYISIDQVPETNAIILSRPVWLWGGEMGVNEHGVCIGNEAVFTKGKYGKESLIGMDLLRLALERANNAYSAVKVITDLLERYGQGGNCGYDKNFEYDNSFLIMDRKEIYVLETAGKNWVYRKGQAASISNGLTIGEDGDVYSEGRCDFRKKHSDFLFTKFSASALRQKTTCTHKLDNVFDRFAALRQHTVDDPMCRGTVSSVCMHAGDLIADQTTALMVVELSDQIKVYITGSSRPCLSVFKPYGFEAGGIISEGVDNDAQYWKETEKRQRKLLGKQIPDEYYSERDALERKIIENGADALEAEKGFLSKWCNYPFEEAEYRISFKGYWKKKNEAFEKTLQKV